jgi:hypothetical protein
MMSSPAIVKFDSAVELPARSAAARRKQRRYRKRLACGAAVLKIETPLYPLVAALIAAGRIDADRALKRCEIERELAVIVEEWRRQWDGV